MIILGVHANCHDTNAALLIDGMIVVAMEEERLSRIKHDRSFPIKSIELCLSSKNLSPKDVDLIVVDMTNTPKDQIEDKLRKIGFTTDIVFIRHHDSHAAGVYYSSGFAESAILIVDGHGSRGDEVPLGEKISYRNTKPGINYYELQSFYRGYDNQITLIHRTAGNETYRNGIGIMYRLASKILNLGESSEGKVMGLSAYGKENDKYRTPILEVFDGIDVVFEGVTKIDDDLRYYCKKYFNDIKPRTNELLPDEDYTDLAYKVQKELEEYLVLMAKYLYSTTRCKKLCIGGGVALNGLANNRILRETEFEEIFILPATSDCGSGIGNALYGWNVLLNRKNIYCLQNAFLGVEYSEEEVIKALNSFAGLIAYTKLDNIIDKVSSLLIEGKIIGWFQGKSESGPRALGHRSILADPRNPDMRDILNQRVKNRESYRPFAPSILEEHCSQYFNFNSKSPYMLMIATVKPEMKEKIPSVLQVDGTARIQTVNKDENDIYYDLILSFYQKTGIPMLLNTSFNRRNEPIVETPTDALNCFLGTLMDFLIIDQYLISKKKL